MLEVFKGLGLLFLQFEDLDLTKAARERPDVDCDKST